MEVLFELIQVKRFRIHSVSSKTNLFNKHQPIGKYRLGVDTELNRAKCGLGHDAYQDKISMFYVEIVSWITINLEKIHEFSLRDYERIDMA